MHFLYLLKQEINGRFSMNIRKLTAIKTQMHTSMSSFQFTDNIQLPVLLLIGHNTLKLLDTREFKLFSLGFSQQCFVSSECNA